MYIVAMTIYIHEVLWDSFKVVLLALIEGNTYGTAPWLVNIAKSFQYGYSLSVDANYKAYYAVVDESAKIVKYASVNELGNLIILKVAKDSSGTATKLTAPELSGFSSYILGIKPAGTRIVANSYDADLVKVIGATFYYDPVFAEADVKTSLEANIKEYLQNLDFNGILYKNKLVDAIQKTTGYIDFDYTNFQYKTDVAITWNNLGRAYQPLSGYMALNSGFVASITFTANV
jgi:hypothetical protein